MMPWVSQVSSSLFLPGVLKRWRFGGVGRSPGFTRLFAVTGRAPAARITYDPGAAFVRTASAFSDNALSQRSTQAARSPGWLLGSPIPHSNPSLVGWVRSVRVSGGRGRLPPGLSGAEDRPAADQQPPGQGHHGVLLRGPVGLQAQGGVAGPAVVPQAAPGALDEGGTQELGSAPGHPSPAVGLAALVLTRHQTGIGAHLVGTAEASGVEQVSDDDLGGAGADAGDALKQ